MYFNLNGTTIQKLVLNGVAVDNAYLNGVKVFTSLQVGDLYNGGTYLGDLGGYRYIWSGVGWNNIQQSTAKSYCENLSMGGYEDWFLPTKDELLWMAIKPMLIPSTQIWSSTDAGQGFAYMVNTETEVALSKYSGQYYYALPIRREEI